MRMRVSEQGDEVFIELLGIAGRHQQILQALTDGHLAASATPNDPALAASDVSVRAGADEMHIRLKARAGHHFEALSIYHYLRHRLIEDTAGSAPTAEAAARAIH